MILKDIGHLRIIDTYNSAHVFSFDELLEKYINIDVKVIYNGQDLNAFSGKTQIRVYNNISRNSIFYNIENLHDYDYDNYTEMTNQIQSYISKYTRNYKINKLLI